MANYGIRVSQDGKDVLTGPDSDMILTSKYPSLGVIGSTIATVSFAAGSTQAADTTVFFPTISNTASYPFVYAKTTGSQVFRSNVGFLSGSDQISTYCYSIYAYAGSFRDGFENDFIGVLVSARRLTTSSTYPGAYSYPVHVYAVTHNG
jgi:hypothetical protein